METTAIPRLSKRFQTFSTIAHTAGALGIAPEGVRLAKAHGCPAFRPNGNVNEQELITWLLTDCWQFWSAAFGSMCDEGYRFPAFARTWMDEPPRDANAARLSEGEFQWLRLAHGDTEAIRIRSSAEAFLRKLASSIPAGFVEGSADLTRMAETLADFPSLFTRPSFPAAIPIWRTDGNPFEILQAHRADFWQWTEKGVSETCPGEVPQPPKFLIVPKSAHPRHCSMFDIGNPWLADNPDPDARTLLDFRPGAST